MSSKDFASHEKIRLVENRLYILCGSFIASEIQLKAPRVRLRTKPLYRKSRLFVGETARSVVPKSTDFSAKIIFPTKKWFFLQKVQFLFGKGGTMCKNFEGINVGPNIFGQQLLELFHKLSDVFKQILLTKG